MSDEIYYDEERNVIPMPLDEWKIHCAEKENEGKVLDTNGTQLQSGDTIIAIKPLPVKG
jgi:uncharacterized Zn ribbon protein